MGGRSPVLYRGPGVLCGNAKVLHMLAIGENFWQTDRGEESSMSQTEASHIVVAPGIVRRADRGLCLAGKRVTLYLIMDYLKAGWPPHLMRHWLDLSEAELHHAVQYIETNRTAFEAEYAEVVQQAQAREQYWRERQHQRKPKMLERHFTPEQAAAWARLKALTQ
jgi:uncharacterized protein (DUF433 family)